MTTATDRRGQAACTCIFNCGDNIGYALAAGDQCLMLVDACIPNPSRRVVFSVARYNDISCEFSVWTIRLRGDIDHGCSPRSLTPFSRMSASSLVSSPEMPRPMPLVDPLTMAT